MTSTGDRNRNLPPVCAVVVSFPRSGTHFTMDFLRRNFAQFVVRPRFWESSETLYVNLDVRSADEDARADAPRSLSGRPKSGRDHLAAAERANFLIKTDDLPFASPALESRLREMTDNHSVARLYPFRRMSATLASYRALTEDDGSAREFLARPDAFLGTSRSVMQTMLDHGAWGIQNALPIDIEDMQARPRAYGKALAARFGWDFTPQPNPLPPRRVAAGIVGELVERLRGRASSEVVIGGARLAPSEVAFVDQHGPLAELYSALKAKALRPD